jgi:hypothetical protein
MQTQIPAAVIDTFMRSELDAAGASAGAPTHSPMLFVFRCFTWLLANQS